ncbi:MAG: glycosyltransferase family 4 protein [Candidatus Doudnabacteria bacterium]|nr:glycosyltransferase family 4 protein [Candidatus Doudnabacteria bacterium]
MENNFKKIVFVISRFHPYKGGAEENCKQMARAAARAGHAVTVLTTDIGQAGERLAREEIYEGIRIVRHHAWNQQFNLGFYPSLFWSLLRREADIVHVENGPGILWQEWCVIWKKIFSPKTKFIVTPHGRLISTPKTHKGWKYFFALFAKFTLWPYFRLVWPRLFHKAIAVNRNQHTWLTKEYGFNPEQIVHIPNGIPVATILDKGQKLFDTGEVLITSLGRLAKYKGHHRVIAAFAKAYEQIKDFNPKLVIMGRPEAYFSDLMALVARLGMTTHIEVITSPTNETKDKKLHESQIHILASDWEATGIGLLEAMAAGNALLSSEGNEAANEIISEGETGFIFPTEDTNALAALIAKLVTDSQLRQQMIFTNLEQARKFTWEEITPRYLALISQ